MRGTKACRSLKDIYDHALAISEPKITPVLKGSYQMQGPMNDSENLHLVDTVEKQPKKRCGNNLLNVSGHKRAVSGTCNVCASPCSSCMHNERMDSAMDSNVEASFSDNTLIKGADNFSSVFFEGRPCYKSRMCNDVEHAACEGSNFSVDSSNDSSSANAESKKAFSIPDIIDTSEGHDMPNKVLSRKTDAEDGLLKRLTDCESINTQNSLSSLNHAVPEPNCRPIFPCDKEKHELGCDGDDSCTTIKQCVSSLINCLASKSPVKTEEIDKTGVDNNSRRSVKPTKEFFRQYSGSSSSCSHMEDSKPTNQPPCVPPQVKISSSSLEEAKTPPSFQPPGKLFDASLKQKSSHLVTSVLENTDRSKLSNLGCVNMLLNNEEGKPSFVKSETSIDQNVHLNEKLFSNENKQKQKDDSQANIWKLSHELAKSNELKDENVNSTIKSEPLEPLPESDQLSDIHSDPDVFEDDVNVCDICGDAGREDMLAFCSRCSDGAEHTYCMRVMLDKVPEGEWVCEVCKFKEEQENKKLFTPDPACGMTKEISFNKSLQDFASSNLGILPKLDNKSSPATSVNHKDLSVVDSKPSTVTNAIKDMHAASEMFFDNTEATSTSSKVHDIKKSGVLPSGIAMSMSTVQKDLSRENSFKSSDTRKVMVVEVKSANNASTLGTTSTVRDSGSPRVQARFHSPRGSLSRSSSDNFKLKPKHLTENVHKTRLLNEPPKIHGKKYMLTKSASFKGARTSHLNIDATVKVQSTNRSIDSRNPVHSIDKGISEKKNSHVSDRVLSSSTPSSLTSSKKDLNISYRDGKLSDMSEAVLVSSKGSENTSGSVTVEETKQQASLSEKSFVPNFTYEDKRQCRKEQSDKVSESVVQPGLLQHWQLPSRDMKNKSVISSAPRQAASATGRILKCQRCNEMGHATQSCSVDKVRSTALKPSGERNPISKSSKWKETVDSVLSKSRTHNRVVDQSDRPIFAGASYKKNVSDEEDRLLDVSSAFINPSPLEGTSGKQENSGRFMTNAGKLPIQNSNKQKVLPAADTIFASNSDTVTSSDALNHVSSIQTLTDKISKNSSSSRISAIPKIPHIWQGSFELHKNGEPFNLYDGVQAHISSSASPKVLEVAGSFPSKLHLEEASHGNSWPSQFLRKPPTEEDIALYFFAADFDSYKRNYANLVDNILKKDLVLKGSLDGFELLIFPSTKLPQRSQRWNRFCFLWGVFRRKGTNCSEQNPDFRKTCNFSTNPEGGIVRDLTSTVLLTNGSSSPKNEKSLNTERRKFDLNENSHDEKLVDDDDDVDCSDHLPSKKQRTCSLSESKPTITSMLTNDCSRQVGCNGVYENNLSFREMSKSKSEDALIGPTMVPQTISPGSGIEKEKLKGCPVVIDLEAIPWDPCEEKQNEIAPNVQTGSKATSLGEDGVTLPDIFVRNGVEKLINHTKVSKSGSASYQTLSQEKGKKTIIAIDLEAIPQDLPEGEFEEEVPSWDATPNLKQTSTYTPKPAPQASVETLWNEKGNLLLDQGKEPANKKLKLSYGATGDCDERIDHGSSERFFFPASSCSLIELRPENNVPSHEVPLNEDAAHPSIPNLDLALGAENEKRTQKILPLFLPLTNNDQATPSDCFKNEDSNLSLSLSFPSPKTENISGDTKRLLPEKPELSSSSLLLFPGVIDGGNR